MQSEEFKVVRKLFLEQFDEILQDESGFAYGRLIKDYDVNLFGTYTRPLKVFKIFKQEDLKEALEGSTPLPFKIGYASQLNESVLMSCTRKSPNAPKHHHDQPHKQRQFPARHRLQGAIPRHLEKNPLLRTGVQRHRRRGCIRRQQQLQIHCGMFQDRSRMSGNTRKSTRQGLQRRLHCEIQQRQTRKINLTEHIRNEKTHIVHRPRRHNPD